MKIVYNIYVAVRKLWNAIFGKNGDGSQLVIPGRISGASGDVTVGGALDLTDNQLTAKKIYIHPITIAGITSDYMKIDNSNATGRLSLIIFNDDPEPYTPAKLVNFINYLYDNIGATVRMICGGLVSFGGNVYACNHIYCSNINNFNIAVTNIANGIPGGYSIDLANLAPNSGLFDDGVNAIN